MTTETGVTETHTIAEAKNILRNKIKDGFICPCCNQPAKMYRRKLTSSMAYALVLILRHHNVHPGWVHMEDLLKGLNIPASVRGDAPKLRFWGLIEPKTGEKEDGNPNNGYYRITEEGIAFAKGRAKAHSHIWLYNNKAFGIPADAELIDIYSALNNKFRYSEIL